jgi:urease gamma subunit
METKFLSDGRKVVVVGQLNNVESIVQEIFVTANGDEIPGGERFTSKSLFDAPVVSYKQKQEKEWEAQALRYKESVALLGKDILKAKQELKAVKELLVQSKKIEAAFGAEHVERIASFMTGQIEYLVVEEYDITPPVKMIDKVVYWNTGYGERQFDSIKLCSVLGQSDGDLAYCIHQYRDASGSYVNVYPCLTLEEAHGRIKAKAEALIDKGHISDKSWLACQDIGIVLSKTHWDKRMDQQEVQCQKQREQLEKQLADINTKLQALSND